MVSMKEYASDIMKLVKECNHVMRVIHNTDLSRSAFLPWNPYIFDAHTDESAFAQEVINYYQLIGECGGYLWTNRFMDVMKNDYSFDLPLHKKTCYDALRAMRLFFSHRSDRFNKKNLLKLCEFLDLSPSVTSNLETSVDFVTADGEVLCIAENKAFWKDKRKQLFEMAETFLKEYLGTLQKIAELAYEKRKKFYRKFHSALVEIYCKEISKYQGPADDFVLEWIEDTIAAGVDPITKRKLQAVAQTEGLRRRCCNLFDKDNIENELNNPKIYDLHLTTALSWVLENHKTVIIKLGN